MQESRCRAFFAIPPDAQCLESLLAIEQSLKLRPWTQHIRWIQSSNLHITLLFLGDVAFNTLVPVAEHVRATVSECAFSISISHLALFPNARKPSVVAAVIENNKCMERLHKEISTVNDRFGIKKEKRRFRPHLTLGRCKRSFHGVADIQADQTPIASLVDQIVLYKSDTLPQGAVYTRLDSIRLKPTGDMSG